LVSTKVPGDENFDFENDVDEPYKRTERLFYGVGVAVNFSSSVGVALQSRLLTGSNNWNHTNASLVVRF
jgi:hypothetical protein